MLELNRVRQTKSVSGGRSNEAQRVRIGRMLGDLEEIALTHRPFYNWASGTHATPKTCAAWGEKRCTTTHE